MQISINNNFADDGTLTVSSDDDTNQTKANMEDPSFSTKYTSNGTATNFYIQKTFTTGIDVGYIAIFGHNIGVNGATITLKCNNSTVDTVTVAAGDGNHVIMSTFTEVSTVTDIDIEIVKNTTADQITITGIAAGQYMDVPNDGEQAGFPRNWLTRNQKLKTITNDAAGPVAILTKAMARKAKLIVKNASLTFIEGTDWSSLVEMAFEKGYLFIKEHDGSVSGISDDPLSSCMAFDIDIPAPKAHPATRQLVQFEVDFKAYTGV